MILIFISARVISVPLQTLYCLQMKIYVKNVIPKSVNFLIVESEILSHKYLQMKNYNILSVVNARQAKITGSERFCLFCKLSAAN